MKAVLRLFSMLFVSVAVNYIDRLVFAPGQLYKPYRKGEYLDANKYGYTGAQWPGEVTATLELNSMYIGKDVTGARK